MYSIRSKMDYVGNDHQFSNRTPHLFFPGRMLHLQSCQEVVSDASGIQ